MADIKRCSFGQRGGFSGCSLCGTFTKGNEAVVVNGEGFAGALSIAPIAGEKGIPVLLTQNSELSSSIKSFATDQNISKTYVIDGTGVVSDNVLNALPSAEPAVGYHKYKTKYIKSDFFTSK